jgi:hypothetical protein
VSASVTLGFSREATTVACTRTLHAYLVLFIVLAYAFPLFYGWFLVKPNIQYLANFLHGFVTLRCVAAYVRFPLFFANDANNTHMHIHTLAVSLLRRVYCGRRDRHTCKHKLIHTPAV